jgi:hypothetical protein
VIVITEFAEAAAVPAGIVAGFGVHVAPVSPIGKEHAMVAAEGSTAPDGVVAKFIWSI